MSLLRLAMTRAILIALFCTCFSLFNIPVFWPILVLYFIILFVITMKRQILVRCSAVCTGPRVLCYMLTV